MNISEIHNNQYELIVPKFVCDGELVGVPDPFPKNHFSMVILGKPGSGKSSLAVSMMTNGKKLSKVYKKKFNKYFIICPESSLSSMKTNPFNVIDEEDIYHEFDYCTLLDIYEKCTELAEDNRRSLLYIDDMMAEQKGGGDAQNNLFLKLLANRRHLRLSVINCVQRLTSIPKSIRAMTSDFIFFKPNNVAESKIIHSEMVNLTSNEFSDLCNFGFKKKHDNILYKLEDDSFYKNFNKLSGVKESAW